MVEIKCKHAYTKFQKDTFSICEYKTFSPVTLPDGTQKAKISAKGYCLPDTPGITVILKGDFVRRTDKSGKTQFTLDVKESDEVLPTEKDSVIKYLSTLNGIGKSTACLMWEKYQSQVFNIIENTPEELIKIKGISQKKVEKITCSYASKKLSKELFQYLFRFGIAEGQIMRIFKVYGDESLEIVKNDPYKILQISSIGWSTAEAIAKGNKHPLDSPSRIKAGIIEVLLEGEIGSPLLKEPFPDFCFQSFLRKELFDMLYSKDLLVGGNTYLPRNIVYLLTLKLLKVPITEQEFDNYSLELRKEKRLFMSIPKDKKLSGIKYYRYITANNEYSIAKKICKMMEHVIEIPSDLDTRISYAEKNIGVMLSSEQKEAVKCCLSNPVSIITGGPGTGKTSVQKILLSTFKAVFPHKKFMLAAPTGRAASRMSESTGFHASTLHKILGLHAGTPQEMITTCSTDYLDTDLIIVDESSMIDSSLMAVLVKHLHPHTQIAIVGDVDQLPSIGAGCVLRELIDSNVVPTVRLTKVFRQAEGSTIAINAARIKIGERNLLYKNDFVLEEMNDSQHIVDTIKEIYPKMVKKFGIDEVCVLTPFRKSTITGVNSLNPILRELINTDLEHTPYVELKGERFYEGDKVMFTKNTTELTNGDIGYITYVKQNKSSLLITIDFGNGKIVNLEDEEALLIELAYAITIHKSQGSEYAGVIMISDKNHRVMIKQNLLYTGITRASKTAIILGQQETFLHGIGVEDSVKRLSNLGNLMLENMENTGNLSPKKYKYCKEKEETDNIQLKLF